MGCSGVTGCLRDGSRGIGTRGVGSEGSVVVELISWMRGPLLGKRHSLFLIESERPSSASCKGSSRGTLTGDVD